MKAVEQILDFIHSAKMDSRIRPLHISLYLAIFQYWVVGDCKNPVLISRREIMDASKVKSIVSYHKGMQELCAFQYISYIPSYDPRAKSQVFLFPCKKEAIPEGTIRTSPQI